MSGRAKALTAFFLTLTGLAIGTEVWFATDGNPDTWPWTDLIVAYVPSEVAALVFGALAVWLPVHFYLRYRKRTAERRMGMRE